MTLFNFKVLFVALLVLYSVALVMPKIVLPHKLRYLENMLNAEVVAKAAKMKQHLESNPNLGDSYKPDWLGIYDKSLPKPKPKKETSLKDFYQRRIPSF